MITHANHDRLIMRHKCDGGRLERAMESALAGRSLPRSVPAQLCNEFGGTSGEQLMAESMDRLP